MKQAQELERKTNAIREVRSELQNLEDMLSYFLNGLMALTIPEEFRIKIGLERREPSFYFTLTLTLLSELPDETQPQGAEKIAIAHGDISKKLICLRTADNKIGNETIRNKILPIVSMFLDESFTNLRWNVTHG